MKTAWQFFAVDFLTCNGEWLLLANYLHLLWIDFLVWWENNSLSKKGWDRKEIVESQQLLPIKSTASVHEQVLPLFCFSYKYRIQSNSLCVSFSMNILWFKAVKNYNRRLIRLHLMQLQGFTGALQKQRKRGKPAHLKASRFPRSVTNENCIPALWRRSEPEPALAFYRIRSE